MHVLFVHENFPAQFGHVATRLTTMHGFRCTFVSEKPAARVGGVERIQFRVGGSATSNTHFCSRTFEDVVWHMHAVFDALANRPDIRPDLIVGHSGLGPTLMLRELYDCPIINYFEYFYRTADSDMDFRPDFPSREIHRLRARVRNASLLLDLENCDIGYSPTRWQRDRLPELFHPKVRVIFDGIDTNLWRPRPGLPRTIRGRAIPDDVRIVTYVSRGMESMRGFDIFMRVAKLLCDRRNDVLFVVVGQDRVCYGGDERFTGGKSFKEWVLGQDDYDLSRFHFTGTIRPAELAKVLAATDLHLYLTVPFVLSWSLMDALACGATVLASDTAPVREMIEHGKNGLLVPFFDVEGFARHAEDVLNRPRDFKHLGAAGVELIRQRYSLDVCLPRMLALYDEAIRLCRSGTSSAKPVPPPTAPGTARFSAHADPDHQTLARVGEIVRSANGYPRRAIGKITDVVLRHRTNELTRDQVGSLGTVVQSGPFAGMTYLPVSSGSELVPKLLGSYEAELHDFIHQVSREPYDVVINVGCGEGYYAVGLARLMPSVRVHAFDSKPNAQAHCRRLAELNGVADRVFVAGECTHDLLEGSIRGRAFILCDCEGAEGAVLDPRRVPSLRSCDILVELHDFIDPSTSRTLPARFEQTHELTLIDHQPRDWRQFPALRGWSQLDQFLATWEARPGPTPWAFLEAKDHLRFPAMSRTHVEVPGVLFDFSVLDSPPTPFPDDNPASGVKDVP